MPDAILALNAGSSSTKLALFETRRAGGAAGQGGAGQGGGAAGNGLTRVATGLLEGIGSKPHFLARDPDGKVLAEQSWAAGGPDSHQDFLSVILDFAEHALGRDTLVAVGHRVVHGGADHVQPERVTPALLDALEKLVPLAPLHQPHSLAPMRALAALRPGLAQVACFDTAFHHTMPPEATHIALPRALSNSGVRRYGFHGLSYEFIARRVAELAPDVAGGRVIVAHLGSGASLCAMRAGRSVDTTMGFTALDGLMMATRCGTIDPGVVLYLQQQRGMSAHDVEDLLYHRSGLLGVSGISGDVRALIGNTDPHAAEALALFAYRIAREAGALASSLGGLDALVFTAGIGEHTPDVRQAACARLAWLGVAIDDAANRTGHGCISAAASAVQVWVIPTDEEFIIADHAATVWREAAAPRA